ncbi:glutathione ABC transporter permease [Alkalihalobacillus pseudalcaliphilus]|nr:glutathione ABC transporter permease [Alkalihalobacillus pseudalcaliphilus]
MEPNHSNVSYQESPSYSPLKQFWKKWCKQRVAFIASLFILLLVFVAILGNWLAPHDPYEPNYSNILSGPTTENFAGTDEYGRDIFSRLIVGTKISLGVGLISILAGGIIGTFLGLISGYFGGRLDRFIMRGSDIMFAFPDILLAIAIIAILGPGLINVVIALSIFSVPSFARLVRGAALEAKQAEYVEAAQSIGASSYRIIWKHILPSSMGELLVFCSMRMGNAILAAATLSFLGLGASPETPDWGAMLSMGRDYISSASHVVLFPGLILFLTVLAFNLVGDGLRDVFDPKSS